MDVKSKRNIVLVGHAHCGKTSLSESLLFKSGATSRKGDVMKGNTLSDFNDDEIERKISINSGFLNTTYNNIQIQIIDTPGYMDFIGETVSALSVADAAVVVVDAVNGVEVGTEVVWDRLTEQKIPRLVFINKADKDDAKVDETIAAIQEQLSRSAIIIDLDSSELTEIIAETDDELIEKYLETGTLSKEEVSGALRSTIVKAQLFPIIVGSANDDSGVKDLLDAIVNYMPNPLERQGFPVKSEEGADPEIIMPEADGSFIGFIFKSIFDPHLGQLSLMRVIRGSLNSNSDFYNATCSAKEHVSSLNILQGKEQVSVGQATCGDIIALPKLKKVHVSDTFTADAKNKCVLAAIDFPEPCISASIKPKSRADEEKISSSLSRLCEEDHTIKVMRDTETNELIISGMGDLHLKIVLERMKQRYNVDVDLGKPKVSYRETIKKPARARHKYKKQSGGRGQYGDVDIEISPLHDGNEYEFVNKIFGGAIPKNYIPSVEKGVKQAISEGVLANSLIINLQITLVDGSYHEVDSSDMAFQIAGAKALKEAVKAAGPVLLEPIMEVSIVVPDEFIGPISGDVSSRRGRIMGSEAKGKNQVIKAQVPLAEMFQYATDLRSMTGGRGSYTMKFAHYEEAPAKVTAQVVAERQTVEQT